MEVRGLTFDTGALIALERGVRIMKVRMEAARRDGLVITVPSVVLTEWWRAAPKQSRILETLDVEPVTERIAKLAGEAIAAVDATIVDAIVMASAAQRGDIVYTSDFEDLDRLHIHFSSVHKVLRVSTHL